MVCPIICIATASLPCVVERRMYILYRNVKGWAWSMCMVLDSGQAQMLCMFKLITHHLQFIMSQTGLKSKVYFHLEN